VPGVDRDPEDEMSSDDGKSIGRRSYEQFAERFAELAPTKPHNAYYDRPAVLGLLPDLRGKRVLDAGCGPGIYAEELLNRGAEVVAVDVTPAFVRIAKERLGERATVLEWDLAQPLTFAEDGEFDVVVSPLVLDYIEDWGSTLREFFRVLKDDGVLVFSVGHPWADWQLASQRRLVAETYFDIERYTMRFTGFGEPYPEVTSYRRPLEAVLNAVTDVGFRLDRVLEPRPTEEFRAVDPERYERLLREPIFLCVRAVKG
jgi:SAM-dependent methyltransferase